MTDAPTLKDVIAEALKAAVHAIYTARGLDPEKEVWVGPNAEDYRQRDDVAIEKHTPLIEAYHAALTAAGYVVAPREPTEAMLDAGSTTLNLDRAVVGEPPAHLMFLSDGAAGCYHAMIAAAPTTKQDAP